MIYTLIIFVGIVIHKIKSLSFYIIFIQISIIKMR